jgi:hypothetical protein
MQKSDVLECFRKPLAALPEHQSLFRQLSHNRFLLPEGIDIHPDAMSSATLRDRAWRAVEPRYLARSAALVDMLGAARPRGLSDDDVARVANKALEDRIRRALVC